jgi:UPF0176 protein
LQAPLADPRCRRHSLPGEYFHSRYSLPKAPEPLLPSPTAEIRVASLYQFTHFEDCSSIQHLLKQVCEQSGVRGTLIIAPEGINGTIAGSDGGISNVLRHIRSLPGCADIAVKDSSAGETPFQRLKVKIKPEIVTMGEPDISPLDGVGEYVAPAEWNDLICDPDTIVIDTRNRYEVEVGTFKGAINPATDRFRDFPNWFRERRASLTKGGAPKIAMFCTGGIRCEKATALLKAEGIEKVYHLQGGILKYLEEVPAEASLWEGECFVFDERVSLAHGLETGTLDICHACRLPVTKADRADPGFEDGVSCPACCGLRTSSQLNRYAERHRQMQIAEKRGAKHIGQDQGHS